MAGQGKGPDAATYARLLERVESPEGRFWFLIEDRCAAAALLMEVLEEQSVDDDSNCVETRALAFTARELRTLERAASDAQSHPERLPELARQLETLWHGPPPKSLLDLAPRLGTRAGA